MSGPVTGFPQINRHLTLLLSSESLLVYQVKQKMIITDVKVRKLNREDNLKAFASITIDDAFVVKEIRVVEGKNGLFVAMPSKKIGDKYMDISHPITAEWRQRISTAVLSEYGVG